MNTVKQTKTARRAMIRPKTEATAGTKAEISMELEE